MCRWIKASFLKLAAVICAVVFAGVFQGCATSRFTDVWSDPGYTGGPVKSVVVVGVSDKAEQRRLFENNFSQELKKLGVNAVVSETILPAAKQANKEEATEIIRNSGSQAAIVTRVISLDTINGSVEGRPEYDSGARFSSANAIVYVPPSQSYQYRVVKIETSLYDLATEDCIWRGISEAVDPNNVDFLIDSIIKTVIKDMQNKKLLPL